jgi:hypothetical protein
MVAVALGLVGMNLVAVWLFFAARKRHRLGKSNWPLVWITIVVMGAIWIAVLPAGPRVGAITWTFLVGFAFFNCYVTPRLRQLVRPKLLRMLRVGRRSG